MLYSQPHLVSAYSWLQIDRLQPTTTHQRRSSRFVCLCTGRPSRKYFFYMITSEFNRTKVFTTYILLAWANRRKKGMEFGARMEGSTGRTICVCRSCRRRGPALSAMLFASFGYHRRKQTCRTAAVMRLVYRFAISCTSWRDSAPRTWSVSLRKTMSHPSRFVFSTAHCPMYKGFFI